VVVSSPWVTQALEGRKKPKMGTHDRSKDSSHKGGVLGDRVHRQKGAFVRE